MTLDSTTLQTQMVARQAGEPSRAIDGMTWINPSGGANGNNTERYIYNGDTGTWELTVSLGPDNPLREIDGARWSDTGENTVKVYDGAAWVNIGVSDHSNLSGVTSGQHHNQIDTDAVGETILDGEFTNIDDSSLSDGDFTNGTSILDAGDTYTVETLSMGRANEFRHAGRGSNSGDGLFDLELWDGIEWVVVLQDISTRGSTFSNWIPLDTGISPFRKYRIRHVEDDTGTFGVYVSEVDFREV